MVGSRCGFFGVGGGVFLGLCGLWVWRRVVVAVLSRWKRVVVGFCVVVCLVKRCLVVCDWVFDGVGGVSGGWRGVFWVVVGVRVGSVWVFLCMKN